MIVRVVVVVGFLALTCGAVPPVASSVSAMPLAVSSADAGLLGATPVVGGQPVAPAATRAPSVASPAGSQTGELISSERLLRLQMELPVEPTAVWDAWTRAEQLVEWFPHQAQMTVAEGGEYEFRWDGFEGAWRGTYVVIERPEILEFTWEPPVEFAPDSAYLTSVRLSFEELDGSTLLTLEHSGFRSATEMDTTLQHWEGYLLQLRAFLLQSGSGASASPGHAARVPRAPS